MPEKSSLTDEKSIPVPQPDITIDKAGIPPPPPLDIMHPPLELPNSVLEENPGAKKESDKQLDIKQLPAQNEAIVNPTFLSEESIATIKK